MYLVADMENPVEENSPRIPLLPTNEGEYLDEMNDRKRQFLELDKKYEKVCLENERLKKSNVDMDTVNQLALNARYACKLLRKTHHDLEKSIEFIRRHGPESFIDFEMMVDVDPNLARHVRGAVKSYNDRIDGYLNSIGFTGKKLKKVSKSNLRLRDWGMKDKPRMDPPHKKGKRMIEKYGRCEIFQSEIEMNNGGDFFNESDTDDEE